VDDEVVDVEKIFRRLGKNSARGNTRPILSVILAAWEDDANRQGDIIGAQHTPIEALWTLLAGKPVRAPRKLRFTSISGSPSGCSRLS